MVNKNYFTSQDASYSRTNSFTKINIIIDFTKIPYTITACDNFEELFFKTGGITTEIILPVKSNSKV